MTGISTEIMKPDLRIFPNSEELSRAAAEAFVLFANNTITKHDRFAVALAGGNTPQAIYQLLATEYREQIPWPKVHLFWGDERYVPMNDPNSNYRMVREALLDHISITAKNVHRMPTEFIQPDEAARRYEQTLRDFFGNSSPRFDLIMLGLGKDAHCASLFPGSSVLQERERFVAVAESPQPPKARLTLTFPVINQAAKVYFFVVGEDKAPALQSTLAGPLDLQKFPAQAVQPAGGQVIWWVDEKAASLLKR
jgi:6-phosphogluconolactonase